jgi:hypothetical protein
MAFLISSFLNIFHVFFAYLLYDMLKIIFK